MQVNGKITITLMVLILALSLAFISCGDKKQAKSTETKETDLAKENPTAMGAAKAPKTQPEPPKIDPEKVVTVIEMEKGGKVVFEFYPKDAPKTVDNFIALANKGFYDGLTFHRIIEGFMAQGGDPDGTGMGGPGYSIMDEFNSQKHIRGTVAMARSELPNSAGSQFYICYEPQPHLDGDYTVFGQVTEGMDVVDKIVQGDIMKKVSIVDKASLKKSK